MLRRLLGHVASSALVVAIFFALLEVFGRLADPFGISYYPETARYLDTMIVEGDIGYRSRPNLAGRFWGASVSINSLGLRDRAVSLEPAEDEFRILMLGDSVVFGVGVSDQDTIPRQLEQQLNQRSAGSLYRVINMGVPSYNTEQELIQLETLGLTLHPHLVLLMFTDNDLETKMWVFERRESMLVDLSQRSYAMSLLALAYWDLRLRLTGHDNRLPYLENREENPRWSVVEAALARISDLCREKGARFVLFSRESSSRLASIAARLGIAMIDLEPLLKDPRWNKAGLQLTVSQVDTHPNRAGTEIYSTLIRESLEQLDLLPGARTTPAKASLRAAH